MEPEPLLPDAHAARFPPEKLTEYVLNPEHPSGRHKARVFASALGFRLDDWQELRQQVLERLPASPVTAIRMHREGRLYEVPILIDGRNGHTHRVVTAWLVIDDLPPRLVTLYVETR